MSKSRQVRKLNNDLIALGGRCRDYETIIISGTPGPQGEPGISGAVGPQGDPGISGAVGPAGPNWPASHTFYVDVNRTDLYSPDGSPAKPFLTIQAAVDQVAAVDSGVGGKSYCVSIANGVYAENLRLENNNLRRLSLHAEGVVAIEPASGISLQSTTNNNNLTMLHIDGITFPRPFVISGTNGSTAFVDTQFENCNFVAGVGGGFGTISVGCVNNFSVRRCYIETAVTLNNVNYLLLESTQLQDALSISNSDTNIPSWGKDAASLLIGSYLTSNLTFNISGTATQTFAPNATRVEASSGATIPAGVTVLAYNSFLRGPWVNNGSLTLRNSQVEGSITGTGTLNLQNRDYQIANSSTVSGTTVKDALNTLYSAQSNLQPMAAGSSRPGSPHQGQMFFDTGLSPAVPIWYNPVTSGWVNCSGIAV